jgi:hypothetical protein
MITVYQHAKSEEHRNEVLASRSVVFGIVEEVGERKVKRGKTV